MKKILCLAFASSLLLNLTQALAQIPNAGFENWTTVTSYTEPDNWKTGNQYSTQLFQGICAVDTNDAHTGTKAMKLKTTGSFNFPGVAVTGTIVVVGTSSFAIGGGFGWTSRSSKLSGFYKYNAGLGIDSALVKVILFKRNGANRDTIAVGTKGLGGQTAYTSFDVNFIYQDWSTNPDSALIIIQSSKNLLGAQAGSALEVDDLLFSGNVPAGIHTVNTPNFSVTTSPNPASSFVSFSFKNLSNATTLNIYDLLGKKIKSVTVDGSVLNVSTDAMENGLYFYQVADRTNAILSTGKFSIRK